MSGLLYEVNRAQTEELLRQGERQRLAATAKPGEAPARPRNERRPGFGFWPFRRVARARGVAVS
jgi:hypothetical protein